MSIFDTKVEKGSAAIDMARPKAMFPLDVNKPPLPQRPEVVRTAQTQSELFDSRRADDAMSVANLNRPRRGHDV
jgi:hypothetical protein